MSATLVSPAWSEAILTSAPRRVRSVDVLRGVTIALMILVNDPGDWGHVFGQLDHAEWNGWTLTDLVFPTFLFLMGMSLVFSLRARAARGNCWKTLTGHLFARTGKLLLLTFVLVYFPRMHWRGLRYFGVLPRIAECSLVAGLVLVATMKRRGQWVWVAAIVVVIAAGYWVVMRWVPVPGWGMPGRDVPFLDESRNLAAWLDRGTVAWTQRWLHTGYLYRKTSDPEGLLSTVPAVATTLLGALAAMWMRGAGSRRTMLLGLLGAGVSGFAAGSVWGWWFPINKNLWTSSYVLLAAGIAAMLLAGLSWLVDARDEPWPLWLRALTWPWLVFGSNAIAAYTVSVVLVKTALYFRVGTDGGRGVTVWNWIYVHGFSHGQSTVWTSLAFAVVFVGVCFLPNWWLWRRRWFWKM